MLARVLGIPSFVELLVEQGNTCGALVMGPADPIDEVAATLPTSHL